MGMDTFAEAEAILKEELARKAREKAKGKGKAKDKSRMLDEMDEEDELASDGLELGLGKFNLRSSSVSSSGSKAGRDADGEDDRDSSGGDDAQRSYDAVALLGTGDGEAVRKILRDDRNEQDSASAGKAARGVRIFEERRRKRGEDAAAMVVDADQADDVPKLPIEGADVDTDPVLYILAVTVRTGGKCIGFIMCPHGL